MTHPVLELRSAAYGDPDAVALVARVQEEYVDRYGGPDEPHPRSTAKSGQSPTRRSPMAFEGIR